MQKKYKKFECKLTYDDDYDDRIQSIMYSIHETIRLRLRLMSDEAFDSWYSQVRPYGSGNYLIHKR